MHHIVHHRLRTRQVLAAGFVCLGLAASPLGAGAQEQQSTVQMAEAVEAGETAALVPLGFAYLEGKGVPRDVGRAVDLMAQAVEAGVEGADGALLAAAYAYQSEENGSPDPQAAAAAFQRAVELGVDGALVPLGFAYLTGNGVAQDVDRAGELMLAAVEAGVPDAGGALLAVAYGKQSGDLGEADPKGGAALFERAVELGVNEALVPLGFAYLSGTGVEADAARAAELMAAAVEAGVPDAGGALLAVAYGYQAENAPEAVRLFQQAVELGVIEAQVPLGFAYLTGTGVEADAERAAELMAGAVESGVDNSGGALLAVAYGQQEADPERAAELFQQAVDLGVDDALVPLGFAYLSGNGVEADAEKAAGLMLDAVKAGVEGAGGALVGVAYGFQAGKDFPADPQRAAELFAEAAELGVGEALLPLGFAYQSGAGVKRDASTALEYFRRAAAAGQEGSGTLLVNIDPNAYVSFLQEELAERGYLSGRVDGQADRRTIRAFLAFCREADIERACLAGPLAPSAIEAFTASLKGAGAAAVD